jgi:UDP-4-amino-4,6-dideoxy-N-acetyl-beta-L-altrosamine N-acetyltransferase
MGGDNIQQHRYTIRELAEKDLDLVLHWRNSEKVRANIYSDQIITMEQHLAWYKRLIESDNSFYLMFEYNGLPSGIVNFVQMEHIHKRCHWGFYLGEANLPKGTGSIMCQLGLQYAFKELNMRKICGEVLAFNTASIKLHEKLEFQQEGLYKQHVWKNGAFVDVLSFAIFSN